MGFFEWKFSVVWWEMGSGWDEVGFAVMDGLQYGDVASVGIGWEKRSEW